MALVHIINLMDDGTCAHNTSSMVDGTCAHNISSMDDGTCAHNKFNGWWHLCT